MTKSKLIIIISSATGVFILGIALLAYYLTTRPDYPALLAATDAVISTSRPSDFYHFSDLTDGGLTETEHSAAIDSANQTVDNITSYLATLEDTTTTLEENHINKTPYVDEYENYLHASTIVAEKLKAGKDDLHLYISFANRFYASNLRYLTASDTDAYDLLATVSDEQVDQIFEPLMGASSDGLRAIGEQLGDAVKKLTAFYSKYAVYISGEQPVTANIYDELTRDTDELQDTTNQLNITLDEKVIFNLEDHETAALDSAALDLHNALRSEISK